MDMPKFKDGRVHFKNWRLNSFFFSVDRSKRFLRSSASWLVPYSISLPQSSNFVGFRLQSMLYYLRLYNSIWTGYSSEMPRHVEAIQMTTHNVCFYKLVEEFKWVPSIYAFYKENQNTYYIRVIKYALQEVLCSFHFKCALIIRKIFFFIFASNFEKLKITVR